MKKQLKPDFEEACEKMLVKHPIVSMLSAAYLIQVEFILQIVINLILILQFIIFVRLDPR